MRTIAGWMVAAGLSLAAGAALASPTRVVTDAGALVGVEERGAIAFKGVPFAKPPVGDLCWKPPQKPDAWKGDRQATEYRLPCPQPTSPDRANGGGVSGATSEDCLYLNVWVPPNAKNAPVMLWLYGG